MDKKLSNMANNMRAPYMKLSTFFSANKALENQILASNYISYLHK